MATEVKLPALGESVTEGTVTQWMKSVGDDVAVDEPLLEVSTDKVDTEIPSPVAGKLLEIRVDQDETVEVGAVLALVGDESESGTAGGGGGDDDQAAKAAQESESGQQSQQPAEQPAEQPSEQPAGGGEESGEWAGQQEATTGGAAQGSAQEGDARSDEGATEQAPSEQAPASRADAGGGSGSGGQATEVKLPALGESVTEGTVTQWLKSVGDDVAVDEPLLEVSTDKVDTEIPSPIAGKLLEIRVDQDETVEVGAVLAVVGDQGAATGGADGRDEQDQKDSGGAEEGGQPQQPHPAQPAEPAEPAQAAEDSQPAEPAEQPEEPRAEAAPQPSREQPSAETSRQSGDGSQGGQSGAVPATADRPSGEGAESGPSSYVTPLVRKLAAQHDVDLQSVTGTGVGGRIRKQDVLEAAERAKQTAAQTASAKQAPTEAAGGGPAPEQAAAASALRGKTEKLSRMRTVIAARMVESLQISAQLTTVVEVDVTAIARLRARVKAGFEQREGVKLSFLPFFAKATIDALKTYPQVNASIDTDEGTVTYHDAEHLGVAVDTERGLMVPVIKDAGDLSIAGLARKISDLAARTRESKISPDELSGGTFTLTNTGSRGALFDTPIINQPQVGILGTGAVVKRAVVIDDPNLGETIAVRQMCYLALTYDHRLVDGADAARFLTAVKERLEDANFESELGF